MNSSVSPKGEIWFLRVCHHISNAVYHEYSQHIDFRAVLDGANCVTGSQWIVLLLYLVDSSWNVMAHGDAKEGKWRGNWRMEWVVAKRTSPFKSARGRQFSRLLAAEVCASAVVMLDTPCSEVVWRVLATHSIRQFPLHFPSFASPCAITFQLDSAGVKVDVMLMHEVWTLVL